METITIKAELMLELKSKQDWVNKVPELLPERIRGGERLIFLDANGFVFEAGADFAAAERIQSYPCKVYRPYVVRDEEEMLTKETH